MTQTERDYSETLFLPRTEFPMRAGLPEREPVLLKRWKDENLYGKLRQAAKDRAKFILHDGPPYANGNIHIGTALNKILKDVVTRSQQMLGYDSNYVPGWDCHGLPIEWKVEEENYRSKNKGKPNFSDPAAMIAFRQECRAYAEHWLNVQREEFKRLGVEGDWDHPYTTMSFPAEAQIAREIIKFAQNGTLYRGSKPVMWSVVEKTALAEAEVEYEDYTSDTVWVKFPVKFARGKRHATLEKKYKGASVVIWTTTPWTIPQNRAVAFNPEIAYGLFRVDAVADGAAATAGETLVLADKLADGVKVAAKIEGWTRIRAVEPGELASLTLAHPFRGVEGAAGEWDYDVPMLPGDHVTDDAGTGFVHTAPSHGDDDYQLGQKFNLPMTYNVEPDGSFRADLPLFGGQPIILPDGKEGPANVSVIKQLAYAGALFAKGKLKHSYPHSWRSKAPLIYRNTPQWFAAIDRRLDDGMGTYGDTIRARALRSITDLVQWTPVSGRNRLFSMIEARPDWVLSRQRAWGVPICVFADEDGNVLKDDAVNARILEAFEKEGADAWFAEGARERFLGSRANEPWTMVKDILDVWFDSGSTHTFTLEDRPDLKWPADVYLEGSDQHRGWFHSSLLEACGTRGRAPYDTVITHGFTMDEDGRKMSKSLGNTVVPQDVMKQSGADILRLWVATTDYWEDQRLGKTVLQTNIDAYRKLRNTIRWMLGTLAHDAGEEVALADMPELERLMLHRLAELDELVRKGYDAFDFKRIARALLDFMVVDLSAFYFDVRKDALYCDAPSSLRRKASVVVVRHIFECVVKWLAPLLPFTTEEAWLELHAGDRSVHLTQFPEVPSAWRDEALAEKWRKVRTVRRVVTGALELERARKTIGSSLEAAPQVFVADADLAAAVADVDMAEVAITSAISIVPGEGPADAFRLDEVKGVAVVFAPAPGAKCGRSWRYTQDVGSDPEFPDVSARDAAALRELRALGRL